MRSRQSAAGGPSVRGASQAPWPEARARFTPFPSPAQKRPIFGNPVVSPLLAMRKVMLVFGALASECAALPAPANTPLHQETWQQRTAANAARRSFLMAPASQVNMTSKLQLASNIADAEVAAADQAWLNSRAAAKTLSDARSSLFCPTAAPLCPPLPGEPTRRLLVYGNLVS